MAFVPYGYTRLGLPPLLRRHQCQLPIIYCRRFIVRTSATSLMRLSSKPLPFLRRHCRAASAHSLLHQRRQSRSLLSSFVSGPNGESPSNDIRRATHARYWRLALPHRLLVHGTLGGIAQQELSTDEMIRIEKRLLLAYEVRYRLSRRATSECASHDDPERIAFASARDRQPQNNSSIG
jgi:hypothetical protein